MSLTHLLACPGCARHVRASENACPFCGNALSDSFRAVVPPRRPRARLSRAAIYALGATAMTAATACSSTSAPTTMTEGGSDSPEEEIAAYGCPPDACVPEEAGDAGDAGTGEDVVSDSPDEPDQISAAYGLPADAAFPEGGVGPVYGSPPVDGAAK